jgi:hypothetical protein
MNKSFSEQWRLVGFVVEEAGLSKHGNNNTIIYFFLNILGAPKFAEQRSGTLLSNH